jgi:cytochrome c oxidase subunit 2
VESPERFTEWLKQQQKPAMDDPKEAKGRKVFLSQTCVSCHRIRGTSAKGTYAPDLTHLASRQTLASGMRPLTHKVLKDWIANPQALKPGCLMPSFSGLGDEDLTLLTDYLMSLK